MGSKLDISPDDSFYNTGKTVITGVSGGCYCCGQQIHISFKQMEALPIGRIESKYFYIFVCDQCEEDVSFLKQKNIEDLSYDILWIIQEELNLELKSLDEKNGGFSEIERNDLLFKLYKKVSKKLEDKTREKNK